MVENFRKTLLFRVLGVAGSILAFGALLYWMSGVLDEQAANIAKDRRNLYNQAELLQALANSKAMAPEVAKYKKAFDLLLPTKDELVNFSAWADGLSRAHQVRETFLFQGDPVPPAGADAGFMRFSLDAAGAYNDLSDFMKDLEFKAPRYLVAFDDLDLKRAGDSYQVSIQGRVFFR